MDYENLVEEFRKIREKLEKEEREAERKYAKLLGLDYEKFTKLQEELRKHLPFRTKQVILATSAYLLLEKGRVFSQRKVANLFGVTDVAIRQVLQDLKKKNIKIHTGAKK